MALAALAPYRNAREKMAVKEPLDKEGLDLAKPLVSKIWNKNHHNTKQKPCSIQEKTVMTPEQLHFQSTEKEQHQNDPKTRYYGSPGKTRWASG